MPIDLTDDFDLFDGVETVSYQRRDLTGTSTTTYTGVKALRRAIAGELILSGQATSDQTRWHIKASTLPVSPRRGDRIVSTVSGTWEVMTDGVETLSTRYSCVCRKAPA